MNDIFSIDSIAATRRRSFVPTFRWLKPTAKVVRPLSGQRLADVFAASFSTTATAETSSNIRHGMIAVRTVGGIVHNKYTNDPGKLAAWHSAKHVEKASKKKESLTP